MSANWLIGRSENIRIGYWLAEKKIRKLGFEEFELLCRNAGYEIVKLDLNMPLEDQGPLSLILHKLTDQISRSQSGDIEAKGQIARFQDYVTSNPNLIVIDPLESVLKLFDRHQQYLFVQQCLSVDDSTYFTPAFVELSSMDVDENVQQMKANGLEFPIVCKPTASHGSSQCHQMSIVFHEAGLKCIEIPCLAQTFVNHNARLFKIFVVGDKNFIVERPSIKNFHAGEYDTIFFNSGDVSRPNASSYLTVMAESELELPIFAADERKLKSVAENLQHTFGLQLFGVDVIIENVTGRYAVIDINTFPGYEDVPNFFVELLGFLEQKLNVPRRIIDK